ncbi:aminoacyl-tRNA hydrolase [Candidatus Berkelbacteria bacterium RIFCSPHIGHO2_12_FULL_36_9]|uniref:Peptidyl-tRNA hydrolase n=1 Tax=Candidatus Berkelbacteria bacterium RIFCSPHIGHO2_12_FULL_36_9 TaxID=1797469 RepID=A0A1F5EKI2_9BACT|nr:MAG: aminoacyl-tRNA hydrolase [Candidatus Berkelbacteria bacterium RIFCSPHIGHO2_12_FULL_36_9]
MKLIIGLGNPEERYKDNRHNVGFMVLSRIQNSEVGSQKILPFRLENQFQAEITQTGGIGEDRIIFAKPMSYMNNSGEAVLRLINYYKIDKDDLIVICDDLDLELGQIRIRYGGSSAGHNGVSSIIERIRDGNFWRIRVGIGTNKDKNLPAEKYVLQNFNPDEQKNIKRAIDKTAEIVLNVIENKEIKEETFNII